MENYRPELSPVGVKQLASDLYGLQVLTCRELDSYDDRNFHLIVDSSSVRNDHIPRVWPHGYVLKILNSFDSRRPEIIEAKNKMMVLAASKGFSTPTLVPSTSGQLYHMQTLAGGCEKHDKSGGEDTNKHDKYLVRLMEYLPGSTLASVPLSWHLSFQVGQYAAKLDKALRDFEDNECPELLVNWNMQNVPALRHWLHYIDDLEKLHVATQVIDNFQKKVLDCEDDLQKGYIHSDFNDHNILVKTEDSLEYSSSSFPLSTACVDGILDFGDATKSLLLIEIAVAMAYMTVLCPVNMDPDEMSGHALAGYLSELQLSKRELELIPLTICARFTQTLTFGFHGLIVYPDNDYCLVHANRVWPHLLRLWTRPVPDSLTIWKQIAENLGVVFPC